MLLTRNLSNYVFLVAKFKFFLYKYYGRHHGLGDVGWHIWNIPFTYERNMFMLSSFLSKHAYLFMLINKTYNFFVTILFYCLTKKAPYSHNTLRNVSVWTHCFMYKQCIPFNSFTLFLISYTKQLRTCRTTIWFFS